ncbi:MAG: hypothetical protein BIFFINMI_01899 [Phycisphaerae bacterium]|nr:hypothetical protein [Phycisphaerae bacterium]
MILRTLHGYILRELTKLFTVTAVVLTLVLSLGGLLQPLRQHGVSAAQLFQLIIYFFPMMLTFSLPVASLLAATLVYGRLSADNELIACRASGIGLASLVLPAFALGTFIFVTNLLLSNWMVPACARGAADIVKKDLQDIAFNKLEKDRWLRYEKWVITAVKVNRISDNPPRIELIGPKMTEMGKKPVPGTKGVDEPVRRILCSASLLRFDPGGSTVTIDGRNATALDWELAAEEGREPVRVERLVTELNIPPLVKDDVKFKSYAGLQELLKDPSDYYKVKAKLDDARRVTADKILYRDILAAFDRSVPVDRRSYELVYRDLSREGKAVIQADQANMIRGPMVQLGEYDLDNKTPQTRVKITLLDADGKDDVIYRASVAKIEAISSETAATPKVSVTFPQGFTRESLRQGGGPAQHRAGSSLFETLRPAPELVARVADLPPDQLDPTDEQKKQIEDAKVNLRKNIIAEMHSRGAFAVAGLLLIVLGTALGIIFRSGHVLVAFGVAAVPAMFAITMIIMGKQVATSNQSTMQQMGVLFIWTGNMVIFAISAGVYAKLMRH